jgi:hypothetical protein
MIAVRQFIRRILNARYSVSSWLWIIVSTVSAAILLLMIIGGGPEVQDLLAHLPLNGYFWAGGLVATGLIKMYGMATGHEVAVKWGSFVAFLLWVFGLLTFIFIGNAVTVILLILPIMIFNAYLFLGVTLRENNEA